MGFAFVRSMNGLKAVSMISMIQIDLAIQMVLAVQIDLAIQKVSSSSNGPSNSNCSSNSNGFSSSSSNRSNDFNSFNGFAREERHPAKVKTQWGNGSTARLCEFWFHFPSF